MCKEWASENMPFSNAVPLLSLPGLNIMWLHLEQQSFKMTYDQYMEKLEGVAALVNILGQTDKVRCLTPEIAQEQPHWHGRSSFGSTATAISVMTYSTV